MIAPCEDFTISNLSTACTGRWLPNIQHDLNEEAGDIFYKRSRNTICKYSVFVMGY